MEEMEVQEAAPSGEAGKPSLFVSAMHSTSFADLAHDQRVQVLDLAVPHLDPASVAYLALKVEPSAFLVITPSNAKAVFTRMCREGLGPDAPTCVVLGGWASIVTDYLAFLVNADGTERKADGGVTVWDLRHEAQYRWDTEGAHRGPIVLAQMCLAVWQAAMTHRSRPRIYFTDAAPPVLVGIGGFTSNHAAAQSMFTRLVPGLFRIEFLAPRVSQSPCGKVRVN